jgi:SAM-dependent methyltransferase
MVAGHDSCPVCGTTDNVRLYPEYKGRCITTQMYYCEDVELDNRNCRACGFTWNAKGLRGSQEVMFDTSVLKPKPQIMSFAKDVKPLQQRTLEAFMALHEFPRQGSLLDFGAGNGSFLRYFREVFPGWDISGIEPKDDFPEMVADLPLKHACNRPYYECDMDDEFDMVIVMSVLEHVPDPLGALRWIHDRLKPGGSFLMRHPNFANLPGDLFCADHINKMTVPHTRQLVEHAGFEITTEDDSSMLFYFIMKKAEGSLRPLPDCHEETIAIARRCEHIAQSTMAAVERCVASARTKRQKAAVFGTSPIGSMAHIMLGCKDDIACFVDENTNTWGMDIDGLPVVGPDRMAELGVSDLALAISPLYWENVARKMGAYNVEVHIPNLDTTPE